MSHFTLITVHKDGENPEELLAPYNENVEKGDEYAQFNDTEDEDLREFETGGRKSFYGSRVQATQEQYKEFKKFGFVHIKELEVGFLTSDEVHSGGTVAVSFWKAGKGHSKTLYGVAHDVKITEKDVPYTNGLKGTRKVKFATFDVLKIPAPKEIPLKNIYKTFENFQKHWSGKDERDPDIGRYGYWHNPNAKWDWYLVGGRWTGYFKLKEGSKGEIGEPGVMTDPAKPGYVDQAFVKDIDFGSIVSEMNERAEKNWREYEEATKGMKKAEKEREGHWKFGIEPGETYEQYTARQNAGHGWMPFAFIDKDGNWHERGEMGWWGIVSNEDRVTYEEAFERFVESLEPDDILTVWDLHI